MKTLFILNDPPYGTERSYNAAPRTHVTKREGEQVRVFLIGDAAACAKRSQRFLRVITTSRSCSAESGGITQKSASAARGWTRAA